MVLPGLKRESEGVGVVWVLLHLLSVTLDLNVQKVIVVQRDLRHGQLAAGDETALEFLRHRRLELHPGHLRDQNSAVRLDRSKCADGDPAGFVYVKP